MWQDRMKFKPIYIYNKNWCVKLWDLKSLWHNKWGQQKAKLL